MHSFIEFYNAREYGSILSEVNAFLEELIRDEEDDAKRDRLVLQHEIIGTIGKAVGGIAKGLGRVGKFGTGIGAAYERGKYGPIKQAVDSLKELDEILREIGGYDDKLVVLQSLRVKLEQPPQQPPQQTTQPAAAAGG